MFSLRFDSSHVCRHKCIYKIPKRKVKFNVGAPLEGLGLTDGTQSARCMKRQRL
jgi:hypothetical protein